MKPPLVSAIIPTFNRAWCVRRAVESAFGQDYRPMELIVVDDGSRDETSEILSEMRQAAPIPMRVLAQTNRGVSAARNAGIREARGEWIALLDSDDAWLPEKTTLQMALHASRPELQISQTCETWLRGGVRVNLPARLTKTAGDLFAQSLADCVICPSAVLLSSDLLDAVGLFDESYPACEDYEMWLRIVWRFEVGLVRRALVVKHGGHADQLSHTTVALDLYRIRAIVKTLETCDLSSAQCTEALRVLRKKCKIYGQGCRNRGRAEEAHEILAIPERFLVSED